MITILLVDDEVEFVRTLAERIELRGFKAVIALGGQQALDQIDSNLPDVVVLDLKMPGMEGIEVLRRLKKQHPELPVIMVTGHGSDKDEKEALRLGAVAYLQKPISINVLIECVQRAIKAPKP